MEHQGEETLHQAEADEDKHGDLHIAGDDGSVTAARTLVTMDKDSSLI